MIIPIHYHQPEIRLRLTGQPMDRDHVRLVIRRDGQDKPYLWSRITFEGFWPGHDLEAEEQRKEEGRRLPDLVYPCFDISDEGDLVFRFDDLLWRRPAGRYVGLVEGPGGLLAKLDIDLGGGPAELVQVEVEELGCGS